MTPAELIAARGQRTQLTMAKKLHVSVQSLRNWEQGVTPVPSYVPALIDAAKVPEWHYALVTADRVQIGTTPSWSQDAAISNAGAEFMPRQLVYQPEPLLRMVFCFETARTIAMPYVSRS